MTVKEIARRIDAHLKRFERDSKINAEQFFLSRRTGKRESSGRHYFYAGAWAAGRWVGVIYVSYQGHTNLSRDAASRYLDWLDAGNVGTHYQYEARS